MSDIDTVIRASRRLEHLLASRLGATGRGLHAKINSVERRLPPDLVKGLRWVATMRNKVVHDEAFRLPNRRKFAREARRLHRRVRQLAPSYLRVVVAVVAAALATAAAVYLLR